MSTFQTPDIPGSVFKERPDIFMTAGIVELVSSPSPNTPLFGPASAYGYDVWVNLPNGESRSFKGIKPSLERYPDGTNVIPFEVGKPVPVVVMGSKMSGYEVHILAREILHVVPCGAAP